MKKNCFWKSLGVALSLLPWAAPAGAQTPGMRANIPFAFTVANHVLPAGEYQIAVDTGFMLSRITPMNSNEVYVVRLVPGGSSRPAVHLENGMLQFRKYGQRYVLAGIWRGGSIVGNAVAGARPPREYANGAGVAATVALQ